MKKMKRVAGNSYHQPLFHMVDDETGARFKQQRLLQEYLQVQKEFVSKKKKLQIAKQKREILLAEVRFLRHRYNLLKKQSPELETEKDLVGSLNSHSQSNLLAENRSFGGSEHVVKSSPPIFNLNQSLDDEDCYRGRKEDIVLDTLRMEKQQKNWMINEKRVGKKKISWQDQLEDN
ncbi:uncharacterized protein LOC123194627 isoform X2 [Mangifera indica]|uniref:uncharacterized protein LOC123194627 isoform X2 n=1 Tax=Mangifera indica TaxID=29780 RepID=UPI001CF99C73|nr:uncharacterized protein LOC123194627 isoform X2 [Mangifera indica]